MQKLLSVFSSTPSFSVGEDIQGSYVGRMVQQLETKICSMVETGKIIGLAKNRLELARIAFGHEIDNSASCFVMKLLLCNINYDFWI